LPRVVPACHPRHRIQMGHSPCAPPANSGVTNTWFGRVCSRPTPDSVANMLAPDNKLNASATMGFWTKSGTRTCCSNQRAESL
jgi:hypothetical protein